MEEGTSKEWYLSGGIPFEETDWYVSHWGNNDDPRTLTRYLGLDAEGEDVWIDEGGEAFQNMPDSQKK